MAALFGIPAEQFMGAWSRVSPFVHALANSSGGRYETADLIKAIQARDMQLWAALRDKNEVIGVMLSEVLCHPRLREAHLIAATGRNAAEWIDMMPMIEAWGKAEGCGRIKATTRPGWKKLLTPLGFDETHCVLEKVL